MSKCQGCGIEYQTNDPADDGYCSFGCWEGTFAQHPHVHQENLEFQLHD